MDAGKPFMFAPNPTLVRDELEGVKKSNLSEICRLRTLFISIPLWAKLAKWFGYRKILLKNSW